MTLPDEALIVDGDAENARELFLEYAAALGVDLCFRASTGSLPASPASYARPRGRLLVARVGGDAVGCVAMRPIGDRVCEMKRLYVRPGSAVVPSDVRLPWR